SSARCRGGSRGSSVSLASFRGQQTRNRPSSCRDERPVLPRYHPFSMAMCHRAPLPTDSLGRIPIGAAWITLALCAGAYLVSSPPPEEPIFRSGAPGSIRLRVPSRLAPTAESLYRKSADYLSRSLPVFELLASLRTRV